MEDKHFWWGLNEGEVSKVLSSDLEKGLSKAEAEERLNKYGENKLPEPKLASPLTLFLNQFSSFIVWLLIAAAFLSGFLEEWVDAIAIASIVCLNAVLGFFQEFNAQRSIASLKKLSSPTCRVIRDGSLQTIPTKSLVPGDLVDLEDGDIIPADGRVIYSAQLSTQEAALTGESLPIHKITTPLAKEDLPIGDRKNMGFMGTNVLKGKGRLLVTETGLSTELGKIASLLTEHKEEPTPLQVRLKKLGHHLVFFCLGIVLVVFLIGIVKGINFIDMLLIATSLAVAAVPEGLPAIVTIGLAMGVRKMVKRKALIRKLPSVETLGCTTVICTDKTGTLTRNEMCVRKIWIDDKWIDVQGSGYIPEGNIEMDASPIKMDDFPDLKRLLEIGVLCNSSNLNKTDQGWQITGDPTEGSLIVLAQKAGLNKQELEKNAPILKEFPFDSERKCMSILRKAEQGNILFTKGAPDIILNLSNSFVQNDQIIPLDSTFKDKILESNRILASQAYRVLGLAYREAPIEEDPEKELIFVGLVGMMDPPRPEVKQAIISSKEAGVFPVMVTGDHKETAIAIGRELGLIEGESQAISGIELEALDDEKLKESLKNTSIYARVSAAHKLRIIKAWRSIDEVVAVTGDGVNDAPAIKEADIGIAMGIKGSDVAKEAADMIITDDNYASIVNAIEEGRGIYDNIIKFVNYLLSSNIAELLIIFIGISLGFKDPQGNPFVSLTAVQLLYLNLVTDGLPAVALAMDPVDPLAMKRPPRKPKTPILTPRFTLQLVIISSLIAIGTLAACHFGLRQSASLAHTMALTTLVVVELLRVQMVRSQYHIKFLSNSWILGALASSLAIQLVAIYFPPLQRVLGTTPLGLVEWGVILVIASGIGILGGVVNRIFKSWHK
ncbi:MAG: cation-translocating P-type ATPase [Simkaniaceae bacterium]|nr:cation-translocating P-type ATPase [Candidatus Sacchlamyda saccharinae]